MKTVMHWKNLAIAISVSMAIAGAWIVASNLFGTPDAVKGAGSFLIAYAAMWVSIGVWPTCHFE
jgi:hypothetical protein